MLAMTLKRKSVTNIIIMLHNQEPTTDNQQPTANNQHSTSAATSISADFSLIVTLDWLHNFIKGLWLMAGN